MSLQILFQSSTKFAKSVPKIFVINTGGTFGFHLISPGVSDQVQLIQGSFQTDLKNGKYPKLNKTTTEKIYFENDFCMFCIYDMEPLIDSADMEMKHWNLICDLIKMGYPYFDGFVVVHGTNTMDYTASALSFMIEVS